MGIFFGHGRRLHRQLKHRCLLTFTKFCQENDSSVGKFERIMMLERSVFIHLSKDCRRMAELFYLRPWNERLCKCHRARKRKFSSWENANRYFSIFR